MLYLETVAKRGELLDGDRLLLRHENRQHVRYAILKERTEIAASQSLDKAVKETQRTAGLSLDGARFARLLTGFLGLAFTSKVKKLRLVTTFKLGSRFTGRS